MKGNRGGVVVELIIRTLPMRVVICVCFTVLTGCATVETRTAFSGVEAAIEDKVSQNIKWRRGGGEDSAVQTRIQSLLATPLSVEASVQIALLNNLALQAKYEDLGLAQADLVEAGILQNPVFEIMVRPMTNPAGKAQLEFGLVQSFLDILMRPARRRLAEAEFSAVQQDVAAEVIALAGEVRVAYYVYQGALNAEAVISETAKAARVSLDLAQAFYDAGNISDLTLVREQAAAESADMDLSRAELSVMEHREHLAVLLGLPDVVSARIPTQLPQEPETDLMYSDYESYALKSRLDVAAVRAEVDAAAMALGLAEDWRLISETEVSISAERESEGQWAIGPGLEIPIPFFDQGQTATARALAEFRRARHNLGTLEVTVRSQVRQALARMRLAKRLAERYRTTILPLKSQIIQRNLEQYNYMLGGAFEVLAAKQEATEAYLEYIETLTDYWTARSDLETAVGGGLPRSVLQGETL